MAALDHTTAPRRLAAFGLLLAAIGLLSPAHAQAQRLPAAKSIYVRQPEFPPIPFDPDPTGLLKQLILYVSQDQGRDWREVARANPADRSFPPFTASQDGAYWFAVGAVDVQDQPTPKTLNQLIPQLKIILDRKPPVVSLRQYRGPESRSNVVTVEWDVRDENLDLSTLRLSYRVPGSDWTPEPMIVRQVTGMMSWGRLEPGIRMDVRLYVADRAGNDETVIIPVGLTTDGRPIDAPPGRSYGRTSSSGEPAETHYVNSLQVAIKYQLDKIPISGIDVFDLWYTKDRGQHWTKTPPREGAQTPGTLQANPGSPNAALGGTLEFIADTPGLFGFLIVTRNKVGIGDPDPRPGDMPSYWVMVDVQKPVVKLNVQRGLGTDVRNVRIQWEASDENLADRPVTIQYAEVKEAGATPAESDWKPIEGHDGALDRSGGFTWTVGPKGPFRFMIRAKAIDKAGNTDSDQTKEPVLVDLEHPKVTIQGIGASGGR